MNTHNMLSWEIRKILKLFRLECLMETGHSLGKFSRWRIDYLFLFFPENRMTFHANCLHWRQLMRNVKSCFLGKIRKTFQNVCRIFIQSAWSINLAIGLSHKGPFSQVRVHFPNRRVWLIMTRMQSGQGHDKTIFNQCGTKYGKIKQDGKGFKSSPN